MGEKRRKGDREGAKRKAEEENWEKEGNEEIREKEREKAKKKGEANKTMKRCPTIVATRYMQIKITMKYHFGPIRITNIKHK